MHVPAHVPVQNGALMETRLLIGREPVLASKPCRRIVMVPVVPIARDLLVVGIEVGSGTVSITAVSLAPISAVLCNCHDAGKREYRRGHGQTMCFHECHPTQR